MVELDIYLYPIRLIGAAASGFYRTCFNKEPTLS